MSCNIIFSMCLLSSALADFYYGTTPPRSYGLLKDIPWKIGQMVFEPPDQFSFFSSDYSPPGIFSALDMVSPESQLLSMSSVVGITNGFFSLFNFGLSNADGEFLTVID